MYTHITHNNDRDKFQHITFKFLPWKRSLILYFRHNIFNLEYKVGMEHTYMPWNLRWDEEGGKKSPTRQGMKHVLNADLRWPKLGEHNWDWWCHDCKMENMLNRVFYRSCVNASHNGMRCPRHEWMCMNINATRMGNDVQWSLVFNLHLFSNSYRSKSNGYLSRLKNWKNFLRLESLKVARIGLLVIAIKTNKRNLLIDYTQSQMLEDHNVVKMSHPSNMDRLIPS